MGRALWNLVIALINATLILVAISLYFGWQMMRSAETVSETLGAAAGEIAPLRTQVEGMRGELTGLRGDIDALRQSAGEAVPAEFEAAAARMEALETRIDAVLVQVEATVADPGSLIDEAIRSTGDTIARVRGCVPATDTSAALSLPVL